MNERSEDAPVEDVNPAEPGARKPVSTWDRPDKHPPGGSTTATGTAPPRAREAQEGAQGVVTGFTNTGPSGSQSGRKTYGLAPDEETDAAGKE